LILVEFYILRDFSRNAIDFIIKRRKRLVVTYLIHWLIIGTLAVIQLLFFDPGFVWSFNSISFLVALIVFLYPFIMLTIVIIVPYYLILLPLFLLRVDMFNYSIFIGVVGAAASLLFAVIYYFVSQRVNTNPELGEMGRRTALLVKKPAVFVVEIWLFYQIIASVLTFIFFVYHIGTGQLSNSESIYSITVITFTALLFYFVIMTIVWLNTIENNPLVFIKRKNSELELAYSKSKGSLMTGEQELRNRLYLLQTVQRTSLGAVSFDKLKTVLGVNTTDELLKFLEKINGRRINVYHFKLQVNEKKRSVHFTAG